MRGATRDFDVTPKKVLLGLKGPQRIVDTLDSGSVKAVVDVVAEASGAASFEKSIVIEPGLPDGVDVAGGLPSVRVSWSSEKPRRKASP